MRIFVFTLLLICLCLSEAYSAEIYLKNGDRITGDIIENREREVYIESDMLGSLNIAKDQIKEIRDDLQPEIGDIEIESDVVWERKISAGYNKSSGNTDSSQLNASIFINRNEVHINEITLKGDVFYSSSDKKMDAQKWFSSLRYAYSFGQARKWYHFYKVNADHDRFSSVDYRIVPSTGLGYWFFDLEDMKLMAEAAMGYEKTEYRDGTEDSEESVLIPRAFFEKNVFEKSKIRQDVFLYPTVDEFSDYRINSKTVFITSLKEGLSLEISLVDDYVAKPATDAKKNDLRFISSLVYSF